MKKPNVRRSLAICLLLDTLLIADVCYVLFWAPPSYPPMRPWLPGALALLCCWDTVRRVLRFRELTGHGPDLRKRDLGANKLQKEETRL